MRGRLGRCHADFPLCPLGLAGSPSVRSERRPATIGTTYQPVREGVVLFVVPR